MELELELEVLGQRFMEGSLINVEYSGNDIIFWLATSEGVVKITPLHGHKPYLLTVASEVQTAVDWLGNKLVGLDKVGRYDSRRSQMVMMDKILVDTPTTVFDKRSGSGLKTAIKISWEDDVNYLYRLLYDLQLTFMTDCVFQNGKIGPKMRPPDPSILRQKDGLRSYISQIVRQPIPNIPITALDIEVQSKEGSIASPTDADRPILSCSMYAKNRRIVYSYGEEYETGSTHFNDEDGLDVSSQVFDNEKRLVQEVLRELYKTLGFTVTFNGDKYDLLYIHNRAINLGIPRQEVEKVIRLEWKGKGEVKCCRLVNSVHIDLYSWFATRQLDYAFPMENHKLGTVTMELLKEPKMEFTDFSQLSPEMIVYNVNDARLTYKLLLHNNSLMLRMMMLFCRLANISPYDLVRSSAVPLSERMFQYFHILLNVLLPTKKDIDKLNDLLPIVKGKKGNFRAAHIEARPGVWWNVFVVDYKSLYPTEIAVRNIGWDTLACGHEECKSNLVPEHNWWICTKIVGIVPLYVGVIKDLRVEFRDESGRLKYEGKNNFEPEAISQGLKLFLLMFWGVFASPYFNYFLAPMASAIGAYERKAITHGKKIAESWGYDVVYIHTDSLYLFPRDPKKSVEDLVKQIYEETGYELGLDKHLRFSIVHLSANCVDVDQKGKINVTGLLGKKSHVPMLFKNVFSEVCDIIAKMKDPSEIGEIRSRVKTRVQESILYLRGRKFRLDELIWAPRYHAVSDESWLSRVVNEFKAKGVSIGVGDEVPYILTVPDSRKPAPFVRMGEIDINAYVESLKSTLSQVLLPLGLNIESLEYSSTFLDPIGS